MKPTLPAALLVALLSMPASAQDQQAVIENFRTADADGDAALTLEEFTVLIDLNAAQEIGRSAMISERGLHAMAFNRLDADGDGLVRLAEMSAMASTSSVRGTRYCEILLVYSRDGEVSAEVWGTQGVNLCPADSWRALDPGSIQAAHDAIGIVMNGPRYMAYDGGSGMDLSGSALRPYGEIDMRLLATLQLGAAAFEEGAYQPRTVLRSNTWEFHAGSEIYELTDPDGATYVMQAWSQIVDPDLAAADLADLGARLDLPEGWSFSTQVLTQELLMQATGEAVVVQDELQNTYQRR